MAADWGTQERRLGQHVSVLMGTDLGKYPSGNSLLVRGQAETIIIDPSIDVVSHGGAPLPVDAVLNSHAHEDHLAGNSLFHDARIHIHEADLPGAQSIDGLMNIYGFEGEGRRAFEKMVVEEFHFAPRPDAVGFSDGARFDLGGTNIEAVHLPGHTRGHSGFRISDGVFFLSDIDLTGFGPYYGDVWSDLEDFEASLQQVRSEDADFYVTFHHKGIIEGRPAFLALLDDFAAIIPRRHEAMLEYLREPHTIKEMVAHRFIYRPHIQSPFADQVEQRCAHLHLQRMQSRGEAKEVEPGRFQRNG